MVRSPKPFIPVSDELLHATATLATRLLFIAEHECGLEPFELFVLWHIKHHGRPDSANRPVMLRRDLTSVLKKKFGYSDSDVSKLLDALHDDGFVQKGPLTTEERLVLFGGDSGAKLAVALQPAGSAKIEEFKSFLTARFNFWLSEQSRTTRLACRKLQPIAMGFAQWLLDRYQPSSTRQGEPPE